MTLTWCCVTSYNDLLTASWRVVRKSEVWDISHAATVVGFSVNLASLRCRAEAETPLLRHLARTSSLLTQWTPSTTETFVCFPAVAPARFQSQTSVCECAAFVLAAGDEISGRVHSADLAAFQIAVEHPLAVLGPVCAWAQLDVVLLDLFVDCLFALPIRRGVRIGRRDRHKHEGGGAYKRCQAQSATANHGEIVPLCRRHRLCASCEVLQNVHDPAGSRTNPRLSCGSIQAVSRSAPTTQVISALVIFWPTLSNGVVMIGHPVPFWKV